MERIPEPELMDDPEQVRAYAAADFFEPHQAFVTRFAESFPAHRPRQVLDLGCGPADVTIRFAHAYPDCHILGVDGSKAMLDLARETVANAGLSEHIELRLSRLPDASLPARAFDTVISNSLLHHLNDPMVLWEAIEHCAVPGTAVFIVDLRRPDTREQAEMLIEQYAASEPEILRHDFFHSLLASYMQEEIALQLSRVGLEGFIMEATSDRHMAIYGMMV